MANGSLLSILVIGLIVGFATAREYINCLDTPCYNIRAVVQGPQDVREVIQKKPKSKNVDLCGNLLAKFLDYSHQQPTVHWETLNISYNLLTDDIFHLFRSDNLKIVDITYNKLTQVTIVPSVIQFIAERNNLHNINIQSRNLERLILPKNEIDSLRNFNNLPRLTELDLSCNKLKTLNVNELSTLKSLKTLKLANNGIHIVTGTTPFPLLDTIDLSNNILTTVDEAFNNFPNVKYLNLQGNKIVIWFANKINIYRSLSYINIEDNDWDCKSLKELEPKIVGKTSYVLDTSKCTKADSPYAHRLIKYMKEEFNALQKGIALRNGSLSCDSYKPSPCDGDDNRVYEVAGLAVQSAEGLVKQNIEQLKIALMQEENKVRSIQNEIDSSKQKNIELASKNDILIGYIDEQYRQVGLSGDSAPFDKLNKIFERYDNQYKEHKENIIFEERRNQDKLNEINTLQTEIDDEIYRKDELNQDLQTRNSTVIGYEKKIKELEKKLASG